MTMEKVIIGTRGSALAMTQTRWVEAELRRLWPELSVEIKLIKTRGDALKNVSLSRFGGKGLFTREIDEALVRSEIDLAVHSMKDLPSEMLAGIGLVAVPKRESPFDAVITRDGCALEELPQNAIIGTSSLRRRAQLLAWRPELQIKEFRGNVDTRLKKLDQGQVEATILAEAGMNRLGITRARHRLPASIMLPAPGQGALAITSRTDDARVRRILGPLNDPISFETTMMERELLVKLGGGCQVPLAALGEKESDGAYRLNAGLFLPDGTSRISAEVTDKNAEEAAKRTLEALEKQGVRQFLQKIAEFLQP